MNDDSVLTTDNLLMEHAIDRFGARCEAHWLADRGAVNYKSQFLEHGYYITPIPDSIADDIKGYFDSQNIEKIAPDCGREDYYNAGLTDAMVASLNRQNIYYGRPNDRVIESLERYFESIKFEIDEQLAHGWEITNVRAWAVKPNVEYGSNIWHAYGFAR